MTFFTLLQVQRDIDSMSGNQRIHHVVPETSLTDKYSLAAPAPVAKYPILNSRPNMMVQKMPVPKPQPRKPVVEYNPTPKAELEKQKQLAKQRNRTTKYGEYDPATNFALDGGTNLKRKNEEIISNGGEKIPKYSLSVDHKITRKDNTPSPILQDGDSSRASSPNEPEATFSEDEELEAPAFSDLGEDSETEEDEKENTTKETGITSQKQQGNQKDAKTKETAKSLKKPPEAAKGADEEFGVFDSAGKSDKGLSIVPVEDILGIKLEGPGAKVKPVVNRNDKLILEKKQKEKENKEKEKRKKELKEKQEKLKKKLDIMTSPKKSPDVKIKTEKKDPGYEKYSNIFISDSPVLDPNVKIKVEGIKQEKVDITKVKTEKENVDSNLNCDKNKNLFEKFLQSDKLKLLGEKTQEALANKKSEQKENNVEIKPSDPSSENLDAHSSSSSGSKKPSSSSEKDSHLSASDKEKQSKEKHKHVSSSKEKENVSSSSSKERHKSSSSSKDKHKHTSSSKDKDKSSSSLLSKDKHNLSSSSSSKDKEKHSSSKDNKHSSSSSSSSTKDTDKSSKHSKSHKDHKHTSSSSSSSKNHKDSSSSSKDPRAKSKSSSSSHKHTSKHHISSDSKHSSSSSKPSSDKHHKHQDKMKSHSSGSKSHDKERRRSSTTSLSSEKSSTSTSKQRKPSLEKQVSRVDLFGEDSDSDSGSRKVEVLSYLSSILLHLNFILSSGVCYMCPSHNIKLI